MTVEIEKHPKGDRRRYFSKKNWKIKFDNGTMDICAYKQTLINYLKDINYLSEKYKKI